MVIIATDSAADFELQELKEMDIVCLPMSVSFGDEVFLENISITRKIPPKGVIFSVFIAIFAMSSDLLFDYFCTIKLSKKSDIIKFLAPLCFSGCYMKFFN